MPRKRKPIDETNRLTLVNPIDHTGEIIETDDYLCEHLLKPDKRVDRIIACRLGCDVLPFTTDDGAAIQILYRLPKWYRVTINQTEYEIPRQFGVGVHPYRYDVEAWGYGNKLCIAICASVIALTTRLHRQYGNYLV